MLKKNYRQLLDEANSSIETVGADAALALLGAPEVVFVDLRDPRELERDGKIPGAFHCPRGMLEFWIDPESPYHKPIFSQDRQFVLYCASGWRSALSARTAVEMGLPRVAHLGGGISAWKAAGGQIEAVHLKTR